MKTALITGISGQIGSYLAEILLNEGYEVHGTLRRSSYSYTGRIDHIFDSLHLHYADLGDAGATQELIRTIKPDEIYNLAAQSHVKISYELPDYTCDITALGNLRLLEAVRIHVPESRFYQASSSEMFGSTPAPQSETSIMAPCSPYAVAKLHAYHMTKIYRKGYDIFASNGILFNAESPRRGINFVTQKIVQGAVDVFHGLRGELCLGNLSASRDWGYALEYADAIHKILQHDQPDDFVIATGNTHTIREFADEVFKYLGLNYKDYVKEDDKRYIRPLEVDVLQGDASKARRVLGWEPRVKFKQLVKLMVDAEMSGEPDVRF